MICEKLSGNDKKVQNWLNDNLLPSIDEINIKDDLYCNMKIWINSGYF